MAASSFASGISVGTGGLRLMPVSRAEPRRIGHPTDISAASVSHLECPLGSRLRRLKKLGTLDSALQ